MLMPNAPSIIIAAGTVAFLGNMKEAGGIPPNTVTTVSATAILTVITAMTKGTAIESPVKAFAALVLLAAVIRYVPGFYNEKRKNHG